MEYTKKAQPIKDGYDIDRKVTKRVYGDTESKLTDVERNNATVMSKSNKKWRDDEIGYMSTNPMGRLKPKPKDY